ncbi:putative phage-like protein [Flavobacterium columnare ATCC 49512]|uniref:Phage-like protein n=1 Tax=Flavobacterium columnare (strain ATCC 49512 / CIP 103533 / TG 44/87) TaxID=1041826 RepID=G8X4E7_FLACA|nr:hypothetical protein [Flavobacterium columnare]AEW85372.1 putative phage-like protein [Flavobacterium columnare ATCC 49512]
MNNFYIYKFDYKEKLISISSTVIFCNNTIIDEINLRDELKKFYQKNSQTDKVFVIGGTYLSERMKEVFLTNQKDTFKAIPRREDTALYDSIYLFTFDKNRSLKLINKKQKFNDDFEKNLLNEGLQNIFIDRGGLVETQGTHHYVFPSGKHCDKFLRTGNILLYSSEIYFIAFCLLKHLDDKKHNQIYCDSSSINSIALALSELKNRFNDKEHFSQIPIESFSSYEGLYKNDLNYKKNALLIISASTSGNILNYITKLHQEISRSNIVVLYFLDIDNRISEIKENVLCNLTKTEKNPNGINLYSSYKKDECKLCQTGSYPVEVSGDVFLLEKPKINPILIGVSDADSKLSKFVEQFKSSNYLNSVLKTNYKENDATNKYEIYIDYSEILDGIKTDRYPKYKEKLDAYINQFVPSNTRFIIHLKDNSSKELAQYTFDKIKNNYADSKLPIIISQDAKLSKEISINCDGSVLVVASCISNGKNLLYLSRALRNFEKLRVVYFVGISRMNNSTDLKVLKSNLKQGNYGPETSTYVEIESIHCLNKSKSSAWLQELNFIKDMITVINDDGKYLSSRIYFNQRKEAIINSSDFKKKGLTQELFFPTVTVTPYKQLKIRNNFAFWNFDDYVNQVCQSDIYFTISNILNSLRNSDKIEKSLKQSSFVRNLISPGNFNRFNDGIIQASILRSSNPEELSYSIDYKMSLEMKNILETLIKYHEEEQGEALLEFLYAIAIRKLSLKEEHLVEVLQFLESHCSNDIIRCFTLFIQKEIIDKDKDDFKRVTDNKNIF